MPVHKANCSIHMDKWGNNSSRGTLESFKIWLTSQNVNLQHTPRQQQLDCDSFHNEPGVSCKEQAHWDTPSIHQRSITNQRAWRCTVELKIKMQTSSRIHWVGRNSRV